MKKEKVLLFNKLGIKRISDLLGRKMEVSFFHKLDASWYFVEICFVIQSCTLEHNGFALDASICFPWISLSKEEELRLIIIGTEDYLIQYKSPVTDDKPIQSEIEEFFTKDKRGNNLSRAKYRLI
jgi:hypothetical protein